VEGDYEVNVNDEYIWKSIMGWF